MAPPTLPSPRPGALDPHGVQALLCDADGNLFGSEEPAFVAATEVTNRLLAALAIDRCFTPGELRRRFTGRSFRSIAPQLAGEAGRVIEDGILERWVLEEQRAVIAHLTVALRPDPQVTLPLTRLASRFRLAVVSSSAQARLSACLSATGLDGLFPPAVRFSAEDSLPQPASKPDPAVYRLARQSLEIRASSGLAVEDSVAGARAAVGAGLATVGNLQFVAREEREDRIAALREVGVVAVVASWSELAVLLDVAARHQGVAR